MGNSISSWEVGLARNECERCPAVIGTLFESTGISFLFLQTYYHTHFKAMRAQQAVNAMQAYRDACRARMAERAQQIQVAGVLDAALAARGAAAAAPNPIQEICIILDSDDEERQQSDVELEIPSGFESEAEPVSSSTTSSDSLPSPFDESDTVSSALTSSTDSLPPTEPVSEDEQYVSADDEMSPSA